MPRKKIPDVRTIDVTGMSIKDIMNIDIDTLNSMREKDLRTITSRLVSASNKRIRSLESHDINSPALRSLGSDKVFSVKLSPDVNVKQRVNKLRQEFARAKNFLSMKTSTIKGYKTYEKQIRENLESDIGRPLTDNEISTAFRILHKLQDSGRVAGRGSVGSEHAKQEIFRLLAEREDLVEDDDVMESTMEEYDDYFKEKPDNQFESYK